MQLAGYHPLLGLVILGLLTIQPIHELLNHFLWKKHPKIVYIGYVHIYVGRMLIAAGMIQGGLGFAYAAKVDREQPMRKGPYPLGVHITYGVLAGVVMLAYIGAIVWKSTQDVRRMSESSVQQMEEAGLEGPMTYRVEERPLSVVRASVRRASEVVQETGDRSNSESAVVSETPLGSSALGESGESPRGAPSRMSSVKRIFKSDAL